LIAEHAQWAIEKISVESKSVLPEITSQAI
jgi:hypothetical protein